MMRWWSAAATPVVDDALRALHEHAANAVDFHRPVCLASGRCCQFTNHDHLLVATGLEAAWTMRTATRHISVAAAQTAHDQGVCAYLDGKLCSIHTARPTGCRTYFCDRGDGLWQPSLSQSMHRSIQSLHDEQRIPYLCAEWTWLLKSLTGARDRGLLSGAVLA